MNKDPQFPLEDIIAVLAGEPVFGSTNKGIDTVMCHVLGASKIERRNRPAQRRMAAAAIVIQHHELLPLAESFNSATPPADTNVSGWMRNQKKQYGVKLSLRPMTELATCR